jgi:hypothetical protein
MGELSPLHDVLMANYAKYLAMGFLSVIALAHVKDQPIVLMVTVILARYEELGICHVIVLRMKCVIVVRKKMRYKPIGLSGVGTEECSRSINTWARCLIKMGERCTRGTAYYTNCLLQLGECKIKCETGICEDGICVCNPSTSYPCGEETDACIDSKCQISPCRQSPYKVMQHQVGTLQMNITHVNKM